MGAKDISSREMGVNDSGSRVGSSQNFKREEQAMVDFKKLSTRAKDIVEKRGGTDALKQDAAELREIAKGKGSLSDKAKAAAAALKQEGAKDPAEPAAAAAPAAEQAPKPDPAAPTAVGADRDAEAEERKAERRKERAERKAADDDPAP
jgi:hypothetical protein